MNEYLLYSWLLRFINRHSDLVSFFSVDTGTNETAKIRISKHLSPDKTAVTNSKSSANLKIRVNYLHYPFHHTVITKLGFLNLLWHLVIIQQLWWRNGKPNKWVPILETEDEGPPATTTGPVYFFLFFLSA